MSGTKIRVVIVDDSTFMRAVIARLLRRDGRFEVVGQAKNGKEGVDTAVRLRPDVVTMDVNMPVMDGVEAVRRIMSNDPLPVVMLSAHTTEGARATMEALSAGAVDFVSKPSGEVSADLALVEKELTEKLILASTARPLQSSSTPARSAARPITPMVTWSPEGPHVVVIAASTGGPAALARVIPALPGTLDSCLVVVQHMPPQFTAALAQRLDGISALAVREAESGDRLRQATVYIAPGGCHLVIDRSGALRTVDSPAVNACKPSADVTMRAVAEAMGFRATGIVMTGMGRDGAEGLRAIRAAGGRTIAQDEGSCVVFGMPRAAIELGAAERVVTLEAIAAAIGDGSKFSKFR